MKKSKILIIGGDFINLFFEKKLMRSAAALTYYLTLSVFPVLICLSLLLGSFKIDPASVESLLDGVFPSGTIDLIEDYLSYVNTNNSPTLFWAGIILLFTTSSGAFRCITTTMVDIQGRALFSGFWGTLFSFVFSIIFLVMMYLSVAVVITGKWFINWLQNYFHISWFLFQWHWLRFIFLFAVMFLIIYIIYWLCTPKKIDHRVFTGAFVSAIAVIVISIIFSAFITYSSRYSLVYGSLVSVIIMMVWLYACATTLLSGNLLNFVLNKNRRGFYDEDAAG